MAIELHLSKSGKWTTYHHALGSFTMYSTPVIFYRNYSSIGLFSQFSILGCKYLKLGISWWYLHYHLYLWWSYAAQSWPSAKICAWKGCLFIQWIMFLIFISDLPKPTLSKPSWKSCIPPALPSTNMSQFWFAWQSSMAMGPSPGFQGFNIIWSQSTYSNSASLLFKELYIIQSQHYVQLMFPSVFCSLPASVFSSLLTELYQNLVLRCKWPHTTRCSLSVCHFYSWVSSISSLLMCSHAVSSHTQCPATQLCPVIHKWPATHTVSSQSCLCPATYTVSSHTHLCPVTHSVQRVLFKHFKIMSNAE